MSRYKKLKERKDNELSLRHIRFTVAQNEGLPGQWRNRIIS